jgi:hypothetical protein
MLAAFSGKSSNKSSFVILLEQTCDIIYRFPSILNKSPASQFANIVNFNKYLSTLALQHLNYINSVSSEP